MVSKVDYSVEKISISLPKTLIKILNEIKNYPKWRGNRSLIIVEALTDFFEKNGQK